jgi:sodium-independent sulfate anion transporter 11
VKAHSGVKTPLSDLFAACFVITSIYLFTNAFAQIPSSSLSAIIMFAIKDLISKPKFVINMYHFKKTDFLSFMVAMIVTIFTSIELGIYSSVAVSICVLLFRVSRPYLQLLSKVSSGVWEQRNENDSLSENGIAVFRVEESLTYPNANYVSERIKNVIQERTVANEDPDRERLWCEEPINPKINDDISNINLKQDDQTSKSGFNSTSLSIEISASSNLKGFILDCSAVNDIDSTGLQCLIDIREDLFRHSGQVVPFLFANVKKRLIPSIHTFHSMVTPVKSVPLPSDLDLEGNSLEYHHDDERLGCNLVFCTIDDAIAAIWIYLCLLYWFLGCTYGNETINKFMSQ